MLASGAGGFTSWRTIVKVALLGLAGRPVLKPLTLLIDYDMHWAVGESSVVFRIYTHNHLIKSKRLMAIEKNIIEIIPNETTHIELES